MNPSTFVMLLELIDRLTEAEIRQLKLRIEIRAQELSDNKGLKTKLKGVEGGHR